MSHVASIDIVVKDEAALAQAAQRLGGEMLCGQPPRWFGHWVDDSPLPDGIFAPELTEILRADRSNAGSLARKKAMNDAVRGAEYIIRLPGQDWDVAVVRRWDGAFALVFDWYGSAGAKLQTALGGRGAGLLKQAYGAELAKRKARLQGYRVHETLQADGTICLVGTK